MTLTLGEGHMASLILEMHDKRKSHRLTGEVTLLGRSDICDIPVVGVIDISREHCGVRKRDDGTYVARDLGSRNGTFINDEPVTGESELHDGDILRLGKRATYRFSNKAEREGEEVEFGVRGDTALSDALGEISGELDNKDFGSVMKDIVKQARRPGPPKPEE